MITCDKSKNLGYNVKTWFDKYADMPLLRQLKDKDEMAVWTFREVKADVMAWVAYFREEGIVAGDCVAMISSKSPYHFRFFYSCWYAGIIAVPICEAFGDPEMSFVIRDCDPKLIIVDKAIAKRVAVNAGEIPQILADDMPKGTASQPDEPLADAKMDDVAGLIYTSGSTGMPKGVMLTHKNLITNSISAAMAFKVREGDVCISLLPYWHSYALVCEILTLPMAGGCTAIARDMRDFKMNLAKYQPTQMLVVPRVIELFKQTIDKKIKSMPANKQALVNRAIYNASRIFTARPRLDGGILRMFTHWCFYNPLVFKQFRKAFGGKLRCVVSGGAPLDLELQIFFKFLGIPLLQGYGLTETSPIVSSNLVDDHLLGSIGRVMAWLRPENGGDYTFKDEEGVLGKELRGQLLVKGDCVMKGYWNHTDASAKSFEDGWLNTGDVGYSTKDGYLFIDGRKGNMIVLIGGEKLHPEHVEDAVKQSLYVSEAMVIGEKCKNVYALVNVHKEDREKHSADELHKLVKDDVIRLTADLAPFQKPKDVLILPDFNVDDGTMTATMKVRRFQIQKKYAAEIEAFLKANGEEDATKHEVGIASSKVMQSLEASKEK